MEGKRKESETERRTVTLTDWRLAFLRHLSTVPLLSLSVLSTRQVLSLPDNKYSCRLTNKTPQGLQNSGEKSHVFFCCDLIVHTAQHSVDLSTLVFLH